MVRARCPTKKGISGVEPMIRSKIFGPELQYGYTLSGKIRRKPCKYGVTSKMKRRPCKKKPLKSKILNPQTGRYVSRKGAIGKRIIKAQSIIGSGLMDYGGSVYE